MPPIFPSTQVSICEGRLVEGWGAKEGGGGGGGYIEIFENEPDKKDETEDGECDDWVPEPGRIAL